MFYRHLPWVSGDTGGSFQRTSLVPRAIPLSPRPLSIWPPDCEWGTWLFPGTDFCLLRSAAMCLLAGMFAQEHGCSPGCLTVALNSGLGEGHEGQSSLGQGRRTSDAEAVLCFAPAICFQSAAVHAGQRPWGAGAAPRWTGSQIHWSLIFVRSKTSLCPVPQGAGSAAHSQETANRE